MRRPRDYPRTARLNRLLQEIIGDALEAFDDERVDLLAVTSVTVEPDLRHATVYFDTLEGGDADERAVEVLGELRVRLPAGRRRSGTSEADTGALVPARSGGAPRRAHRRDPPRPPSRRDVNVLSPEEQRRDGFAIVDKQAGWTSHDVVAKARGLLRNKKIGHSGTLDPDATGVLLLGVGRVTRLAALPHGAAEDLSRRIAVGRRDHDARCER